MAHASQPPIPSNYVIGEALEEEDSFLSSVAQCLHQLRGSKFTSEMLWQACRRYVTEFSERCWLPDLLQPNKHSLSNIAKCAEEYSHSTGSNPELEGRILCNVFKVNIHILRKDHDTQLWSSIIMDGSGYRCVNNAEYTATNTIHVIQQADLQFRPILKKISKDDSDTPERFANKNGESAIETYETRNGTRGAGGHFYEIKLLMLFYMRLQVCDEFYLAANMANVGAFDDAVFKYKVREKDGSFKTKIVFLQAKHSDKSGVISIDSLLDSKGAFSLRKYFESFQTIKRSLETGKGPIFKECFDDCRFIIFTNYELDITLKKDGSHIRNPRRWLNCAVDEIAVGKEHIGKYLNPNANINQDIIVNLSCNPVRELAQEIYDYTLGIKKETGIRVSNELLQKYHISLANKVFSVNHECPSNSKFSTKFHESESLWKEFCNIAGNSQNEEQFREDLEKVTINLHKKFGKQGHKLEKESHFNVFPILSLPRPEEVVTEDDIKEFLTKLEFVLGQKNEKDLDEIIQSEIQISCKVSDEEEKMAIFGSVKSKIESWWKSGNNFLKKQTKFIENAQTSISNFKLNVFESGLKTRIEKTGVQFNENALDEMKNIIHRHKTLNIVAEDGTTLLSVVKSYQTLQRKFGKIRYNFIKVDDVFNIQDYVLRVFQSKEDIPHYLVIESNSEFLANVKWAGEENIRSFYKKLFELTEQSSNKHIILITEKYDEHDFDLNKISFSFSFSDLTDQSQLKLLDKVVTIQGMRIKIKELIPWRDLEFRNKISSKLAMSLIDDDIGISNAPQKLCDSEAAYTKYYEEISLENLVHMITDSEGKAIIFISGVNEQYYSFLTELRNLSETKDVMEDHVNKRIDEGTIIIIPDCNPDDSLKEFQRICTCKCEETIYWVQMNSGQVFLQQVYYPKFYLKREFRKNVVLRLEILCQKMFPDVLVFCTGDEQKVQELANSLESKYMLQFHLNTIQDRIIFEKYSHDAYKTYSDLGQNASAHWLKIVDGKFVWHKSQGTVPDMQKGNPVFPSDFLIQEHSPHVFIFSDIADEQKVIDMIRRSSSTRNELFAKNCQDQQIMFLNAGHSMENVQQDKQTIHWLRVGGNCNEQLMWEKSEGSIDTMRGFINHRCKQERHSEEQMSEAKNKVVVIADEPGMGKSTSLTSVSQQMLKENWVIRINFLDCEHAIDTVKKSHLTLEDVYNFVTKVESTGLRNDWAKLLMKHKLGLGEPNTWPILFLFDGFDEISKERRTKILPFLQFVKDQTTAKLWVTTRFHTMDILENGLSAFATVFEELSQKDVLEFLNSSWTIRLSPFLKTDNIKQRTEKYSSCLLGKVSDILGDRLSRSLGVPLQLRLLAEGLRQDYVNYMNSGDDHMPNFSHVDVLYFYSHFIKEKYEIYMRDKNRLNMNESLKLSMCRIFDKNHDMLAFELLFPQNAIIKPKKLSRSDEDILKSIGIIQSIGENSKPYFIHRTFAEYFVAKLLFRYAGKKESNPKKFACAIKFLNKNIFEESNGVIRNFINHMSIDPNKKFPIHFATFQNKLKDVIGLMKGTTNCNNCDKFGRTPLHIAAWEGHLNVVKVLLDSGCDAIAQDILGKTALHYAVMNRQVEVVEHILNYTTDINICDNIFASPLLIEMGIGDSHFRDTEQLNSILLTLTNTKDIEGKATLNYATEMKDWGIATMLIVHGANVTPLTDETALEILDHISSKRKTYRKCEFGYSGDYILGLLMLKFVLPTDRVTAVIMKYLWAGHIKVFDVVRRYLSHHQISEILDVFTTKQGKMETICDEDHLKVSKYLLQERNDEFMANRLAEDAARLGNLETMKYVLAQRHKNDCISYMKCAVYYNNLNIVQLLEENFSSDNDGNTTLHLAAMYGSLQIVKYLVENKADVKAINQVQETPLDTAISYNTSVEPYLRRKSTKCTDADSDSAITANDPIQNASSLLSNQNAITAEISEDEFEEYYRKFPEVIDGNGATELHWAAYNGDIDKLQSFNSYDFGITDNNGYTLLHYAARNDQIEMVEFLLLCNVQFNHKSREGKTPLDIAKGQSVKFLQEINNIFNTFQNGGSNTDSLKSMQNSNSFIAAINCRNDYGNALLDYAASANDIESVLFMLGNGVPFTLRCYWQGGAEVMHLLRCFHSIKESIQGQEYLLALKYIKCFDKYSGIADVCGDLNENFLHGIAINNSVNYYLLNCLVKHGANINAIDQSNRSVIFSAIQSYNLDLVKFLLYKGVNIKDLTPDGKQRLFDYANKNGRPDITDLFNETLLQQTEQGP